MSRRETEIKINVVVFDDGDNKQVNGESKKSK